MCLECHYELNLQYLSFVTLQMKAVLKGLHGDLVHSISVIIGTIPLSQSICPQQALPAPSAPPATVAPVAAYTDTREFT
jgi:hypothetical protein